MNDELRAKLNELSEKITEVSFLVGNVIDAEDPSHHDIEACHEAVATVTQLFDQLKGAIAEDELDSLERGTGRRVTDLRRQASRLPQKRTGRAAVRSTAGDVGWPDSYRRSDPVPEARPAKTASAPVTAARRVRDTTPASERVGGEVEAWCGPCGGLRDHTIIAVVGKEPKQVLCQSCGARHGYRTTPARSKASSAPASQGASRHGKMTREQAEAQRREEARSALQRELSEAADVRTFEARKHYKVGEIIQHPQHGRGKIENVLKGSLLVRFRDGLKSVSNY